MIKKLLKGIRKNAMLIHTYIHTYDCILKNGRRCSYLVIAPSIERRVKA